MVGTRKHTFAHGSALYLRAFVGGGSAAISDCMLRFDGEQEGGSERVDADDARLTTRLGCSRSHVSVRPRDDPPNQAEQQPRYDETERKEFCDLT